MVSFVEAVQAISCVCVEVEKVFVRRLLIQELLPILVFLLGVLRLLRFQSRGEQRPISLLALLTCIWSSDILSGRHALLLPLCVLANKRDIGGGSRIARYRAFCGYEVEDWSASRSFHSLTQLLPVLAKIEYVDIFRRLSLIVLGYIQ